MIVRKGNDDFIWESTTYRRFLTRSISPSCNIRDGTRGAWRGASPCTSGRISVGSSGHRVPACGGWARALSRRRGRVCSLPAFRFPCCKYRTYFFNTLDAPRPGACRGSRTGSVPRSSSAASCTPNPPTSR